MAAVYDAPRWAPVVAKDKTAAMEHSAHKVRNRGRARLQIATSGASGGDGAARTSPTKEEPMVRFSRGARRAGVLGAVCAAALVVTAYAASSTVKEPTVAQLVSQSKSESGLVFYGNPPTANFKALVDRFTATYPWIKVTSYDLDDNTIFSKYASEAAQGVRTADILIASAPNLWVYASRKKYALDFTPVDIAKYPSFVRQFKGIYVMSPDPAIIVYNKLLLKDKVPSGVAEIAKDASTYNKLTGYTVDNTFGFTGLYGYVQLKGWSNLQTIGKRLTPTTGVGSQLQLVAQGGAVAAYLTSPTARFTIKSNAQYQNILDWTYVKDGEALIPRGIAVTAKAQSPASAKLFLDFVYSKAGQQAMCDAGFTAFRNDFTPTNCSNTLADVYAKVGKKNVYLPGFTQKFVNARPAFAKQWHGIFG
jgi:iron(III) transport system substrate-binding protein